MCAKTKDLPHRKQESYMYILGTVGAAHPDEQLERMKSRSAALDCKDGYTASKESRSNSSGECGRSLITLVANVS